MSKKDQEELLEFSRVQDVSEAQILELITGSEISFSQPTSVEACIRPLGGVFKKKGHNTVDSRYLKLAQDVLNLHKVNMDTLPRFTRLEVGVREWIKGMTLIVAGALLCRYPFTRKAGIILIKLGMSYMGLEYYEDIMDYLIDHKILREKIELKG